MPKEKVHEAADVLAKHADQVVARLRSLFLVEDLVDSLKVRPPQSPTVGVEPLDETLRPRWYIGSFCQWSLAFTGVCGQVEQLPFNRLLRYGSPRRRGPLLRH